MNDQSATTSTDLSGIVTANDVRGIAGEQLTAPIARAFGAAFADYLEGDDMIVGYDMRLSSPELAEAFIDGARLRGSIVADCGLSSTDQLYCASGLHRAAGAMITASHNPAPYNGIKMCLPGARPVGRSSGLSQIAERAEEYLAAGEIPLVGEGRRVEIDTRPDYVDMILRLVPCAGERSLRVVVDAANAMAGHTVPAVAQRLQGIEIIPMNFELDGTFPNHPADPLNPDNLVDLQAAVREHGADLGLAFDGDADRCVVLDETGRPVPPSAITSLIASREIARVRADGEQEPVVVANAVSSRNVAHTVAAAGGRMVRSAVGHAFVKAHMAQNNAVFGGEHSAHFYFRDFFFADSGLLAAMHVLAALRESDRSLSELVAEHDPYASSGEINSRVSDAQASRDAVRAQMESIPGTQIDDLDGIGVYHWDENGPAEDNWWFSLRSSNTEPLLRLNVEAATQETMERVRDEVLGIIRGDTQSNSRKAPMSPAQGEEDPLASAEGPVQHADDPQREAPVARIAASVREKLVCPACGGPLEDAEDSLRCMSCRLEYPIENGVPMLIERDARSF